MGREVSTDNLDTYIGNEHLKDKVSVYLESMTYHIFYYMMLQVRPGLKILVKNIECDYLYINKMR